jgi:hypothetical protein
MNLYEDEGRPHAQRSAKGGIQCTNQYLQPVYCSYSIHQKLQTPLHLQAFLNISNKQPFAANKLHYNKEQDCYYCPVGQPMQI